MNESIQHQLLIPGCDYRDLDDGDVYRLLEVDYDADTVTFCEMADDAGDPTGDEDAYAIDTKKWINNVERIESDIEDEEDDAS